jgi:hypothetical protein
LALIGFSLFPMMPPRLLAECGPYGGCIEAPFVDTLAKSGGLWSFDSEAVQSVSNQLAALPGLHFAWSAWCFPVLYLRLRGPVGRALVAPYPVATLFAVVVTGNHYWADALGGELTLAAGYGAARLIQRRAATRPSAPGANAVVGLGRGSASSQLSAPRS